MSDWFVKNLGDAMLAGGPLTQIEELFLSVYAKVDTPEKAAVFIKHESEGRLHCEVYAYFSPGAVALAKMVDADKCKQPSQVGLSMLIGVEDAWQEPSPGLDK
ncbi:MAG: hypothetical protein PHI29_13460 [Gallionella sp.]|nr:hypothetical protein [Gallionella sp.]